MPLPGTRKDWIDTSKLRDDLNSFFGEKRGELSKFGSTVNQTFEAFVYASVVTWYKERGWTLKIVNPGQTADGTKPTLRLKFSTRGRPENYTYVLCEKEENKLQVRHQLRVATRAYRGINKFKANIVLDVAVIENIDLTDYGTNDHIENNCLITFGEAKHMSAFAELVASFLGVAHEMQPERLRRRRARNGRPIGKVITPGHISPFLFVSGFLYHTANGVLETIAKRGFDIDVYWRTSQMTSKITVSSSP